VLPISILICETIIEIRVQPSRITTCVALVKQVWSNNYREVYVKALLHLITIVARNSAIPNRYHSTP